MKGHHHHRLHKNQFVSLGDISLQQLQYLQNKKKGSSFITQKTIGYDESIYLRHQELNYYLDHLGDKIQGVIQHNEAQILTAYKRHFAKVKKQLDDFKKKTEAQANSSSSYKQKIELLEKELMVFREESLKLFSNAVQKDKIIEQLRLSLSEMQSQKKHMDALVKQLSKRNRDLQYEKAIKKPQGETITLDITSYPQKFEPQTNRLDRRYAQNKRPFSNLSKRTAINQSKTITFDQQSFIPFFQPQSITAQLKNRFSAIDEPTIMRLSDFIQQLISRTHRRLANQTVPPQQREKDQKYTYRSKSNFTADIVCAKNTIDILPSDRKKDNVLKKSQQLSQNLQMGEYFRKCIQVMRKEIGVRKKINSINFFKSGTPVSIQDFKKVDFMRLMELICGNEQIIQLLYTTLVQTPK